MTLRGPLARLRFLLLQVRNAQDPIRQQEVACFVHALGCEPRQLAVFDLLASAPTRADLKRIDMVLLGGSGDYSVVAGGVWLPGALEAMRELYAWSVPTFASCWGFQAMSRALGGEVVTDLRRAELGTELLELTPAGCRDPVFGGLPPRFAAHMGHQDIVERLPESAVLLASSSRVRHQAFCVPGKPIYCTQFHPELTRLTLLERARAYPEYITRIAGGGLDEFAARCTDAPESEQLLQQCVRHFFAA